MRRFIALILALALCLSFTACKKDGGLKGVKTGKVYYLNFKPEADEAWQKLAKTYTDKTGVEVKVVTAASGEYDRTLAAEMDKDAAPTMFQAGNQGAIATWGDYCYDLKGSKFEGELTTDAYNLYDENGKLCSIGYCYEAFGIIVNKTLLKKAGYEIQDIKDFASLKSIAEDIHKNAKTLGFDAFTSSGLDPSSSWRFSGHLANMPLYYQFRDKEITSQPATITKDYLDNYKNIWDLYINNSATKGASLAKATGDESKAEFINKKAVFYQNGTWEYAGLIDGGFLAEELAMIPIYCGVEGEEDAGLCCGTENCWAVNSTASEKDIEATLEFMYWVVTSEEGTKMMAEQFGPCPFKKAAIPENVFFAQANEYTAAGKYVVTWAFNFTPAVDDWRAGVVDALTKYSAGQGKWEAVEKAFVDGWATLYAKENA
ncbi:MAG: ABC transporter substrate-binding protein [Ruminococcaceae bacterium]|nr:ABC transporter substrate-binding protein [Oscillospiraceae bacterium]